MNLSSIQTEYLVVHRRSERFLVGINAFSSQERIIKTNECGIVIQVDFHPPKSKSVGLFGLSKIANGVKHITANI